MKAFALVCYQVLYTGKNFVACAPTGSGKTVLFELAIIRLLMENSEPWRNVKAVYSKQKTFYTLLIYRYRFSLNRFC